jgi:UDP-glucose 4-epimerase
MLKDSPLIQSTILVTGGCGFIGSHLVEKLLTYQPKRIIVLDSLEFGIQSNLPQSPLIDVIKYRLGFDDATRLDSYLSDTQFVFHLAAEKYNQSVQEPERIIRANIIGTEQLLAACGRQKIKKFIFTSSLYAYGRMHGSPFSETEPLEPSTVYGISKVAGEHLVHTYASNYLFDSSILRLMFTYGPRQYANLGYKSVIVKSFQRILNGLPAQICGDGLQVLDYVYVTDVVNALILAAELNGGNTVLNVGSGCGTSINSVIKSILEICSCPLAPEFISADRTAGTSRVADIQMITSLGWKPKTLLKEGLYLVKKELS